MDLQKQLQARFNLINKRAKDFNDLLFVGITTKSGREYALTLARGVEKELSGMMRDSKRYYLKNIPGQENVL